jgi:hypothetical protein
MMAPVAGSGATPSWMALVANFMEVKLEKKCNHILPLGFKANKPIL